ncbi:hypothetical protein ABZZ36_01815 [Actinacidiphila glaucinigra]|uniref:hypothetical protein n=1 Tax=Actinacidiphila glaucinigra TaxID=235986 RepID=UPI0033B3CBA1
MSSLRPTPERPGLWVSAPASTANWVRPAQPAQAEWWCRCGLHRTATGHLAVGRLVADHASHQSHCPARREQPCQHCGKPTRGVQGWPAHEDCYSAWAERPTEQRRRDKAAKAIGKRQGQRAQARRTRLALEAQGFDTATAAALISGGLVPVDTDD